jgi:hypothetical protein
LDGELPVNWIDRNKGQPILDDPKLRMQKIHNGGEERNVSSTATSDMSSRKRKNRPGKNTHVLQDEVDTSPDPALFIQAHEADIVRGPQAKQAADSLEGPLAKQTSSRYPNEQSKPGGLIQWNPPGPHPAPFPSDTDDGFGPTAQENPAKHAVWVDR